MSRIMILSLLLVLVGSIAACSPKKEMVKSNEDVPSIPMNEEKHHSSPLHKEKSSQSEAENSPETTTKVLEKVTSWKGNQIIKSKYHMSGGICKIKLMTAPSYVDDKRIIFLKDQEKKYEIIVFNRQKETCHSIYQTSGIGNIVGIKGQLF